MSFNNARPKANWTHYLIYFTIIFFVSVVDRVKGISRNSLLNINKHYQEHLGVISN